MDDKENNFNFNNQQSNDQTNQSAVHVRHPNKQRSLPATSIADQQQREEINPNKGLFNIFMKIGNQNKSGNTSEENLGNSSSSSSSTLALNGNLNGNSVGSQSRNDSLDREHILGQSNDQPNSILKQCKSPRQRSLEKTIEFSAETLFADNVTSDEEKDDKLYDENGQPYGGDEPFEEEKDLVSWRKQIFSSIQTNTRHLELSEMKSQPKNVTFDSDGLFQSGTRKRTREELRELWRKAIHQQILLIKMEKENLALQGKFVVECSEHFLKKVFKQSVIFSSLT